MNETLTYLQPGMRVLCEGRECLVEMVNDCRARLRPTARRVRIIIPQTGPKAGQSVTITEAAEVINVSPNSPLPQLP